MLIVGGGASGALLAAHLLRRAEVRVTLVERREMLGCGVAYSTSDASHLLNTRVSSMSAFPDEPDHFLEWLKANNYPEADPFGFVSRCVYGRYMAELLTHWRGSDRLRCVRQTCVRLDEPSGGGVVAHLHSGARIDADLAVLATGHAVPDPCPDGILLQPWSAAPAPAPNDRLLIVGCGLTMVDQVVSLLAVGHRGEIVAVSRRGLLPQRHEISTPAPTAEEDLPLGLGAADAMRWLRARVRAHVARGGNWRDVVDGLRPHMQTLWRALPPPARSTFLRHGCAWWEVHRHRMPPESHERLLAAIRSGQLVLWRGAFWSARRDEQGLLRAKIDPAPGDNAYARFARIIDCRGIRRDPEVHATPLVADLLASGRARIDSLRLGLDCTAGCDVLRADGSASGQLFALGPASRAAFWEITAIPDIREQAARLSVHLSRSPHARASSQTASPSPRLHSAT